MDELNENMEEPQEAVEQAEQVEQPMEETPKNWSDYGLDERYNDMPREQFAKEIMHQRQTYGNQSNELGKLRRQMEEKELQLKKFMEAADKPVQPTKSNEWDELKRQNFYSLLEKGQPEKALEMALEGKFDKNYEEDKDLISLMDKRMQDHLSQYYAYTAEESVKSDPDYNKFSSYIDTLKSEEHFGNQRSPKELLQFSKLAAENQSLANLVYSNMKEFNLPFDQAKKFADMELATSQKATEKKEEFKQTLNNLDGVKPPAGNSKNAAKAEKITTMDDAFA